MDSKYFPLFKEVLDLVEANLKSREVVTKRIEQIAAERYWFPAVFKALTGKTVEDYTISRAISDSAIQLLNTNKSVTDLAKEYKFLSQQTYSTMFANVIGVPPHIYRQEKVERNLTEPYILEMSIFDERDPNKVYLEEIEPMRVGSLHLYKSNSKQSKVKITHDVLKEKCWSRLLKWHMLNAYAAITGDEKAPTIAKLGKYMVERGFHLVPYSRYFGFPKPVTGDGQEVSYEAWVMVHAHNPDPKHFEKDIVFKKIDGGLYAVIDVPEEDCNDLVPYWTTIHKWIQEHPEYTYAETQYFEEYITVPGRGGFHGMKLHMPVKKIEEQLISG